MTQIEKLEVVVSELEMKVEKLKEESTFARKHNFNVEATILYDKAMLLEDSIRHIRLKVIEQLIPV